jgi:hypothetical protein
MLNIKSLLFLLLPLVVDAQSEDTSINTHDPIFWVKIVVIIILVILSGIVAGKLPPILKRLKLGAPTNMAFNDRS